jgi:hypothetical protein
MMNFKSIPDNVYADAKPRNPIGNMGKKYADADS